MPAGSVIPFASAIVFDMDGVLIDTEPLFRRAAQAAGLALGRDLSDEFYGNLIGLPTNDIIAALLDEFGPDFDLETFRHHCEANFRAHAQQHGIAPKPGVHDYLHQLAERQTPRAIATSTTASNAQFALTHAQMDRHFEIVVTGDQVTAGKPAPEIYLRAASLLSVPPQQCVAIEDSDVGARAAVAAGMYTILIPDMKPPCAALRNLVDIVLPDMASAARHLSTLLVN